MDKKAILFCEDNTGIIEFATFLEKTGWSIFSNGTTAEILKENNIPFKIEHAFDASPRNISDSSLLIQKILRTKIMSEGNPFDSPDEESNYFIICINLDPLDSSFEFFSKVGQGNPALYSFRTTLMRNCCTNCQNVLILCDPADYKECLIELRTDDIQDSFRMYLAGKALNMVSAYDSANANAILINNPFHGSSYLNYLTMPYKKAFELKHGMNPNQNAVIYQLGSEGGAFTGFKKLHGKEITHRILSDANFAWNQICILYENLKTSSTLPSENFEGYPYTTQFTALTGTVYCILVKYNVVVGASIDTNVTDSFKKTLSYDLDSTIHSTLGCSAVIDADAANEIIKYDFSAIIAPGFTNEAKEILSRNENTRLISATRPANSAFSASIIDGGVIVQSIYRKLFEKWVVPTKTRPTQKECDELAFGMCIAKSAKSYACVCVKDFAIAGMASSYTSRFKSLGNALFEAKQTFKLHPTEDNVIADVLISDSAIELCEPLKELIDNGLKAIIQSGGHQNDKELIAYCDEHNVAMIFTGITHYNY